MRKKTNEFKTDKKHTNPTQPFWSVGPANSTMQSDEPFPPKPNINIRKQASTTYHINNVMGHDSPFPAINTEDLKSAWNLFEHRIATPESCDHNCPSKINQQSTKYNQLDSAMAPKMRGSINNATKAKVHATKEAKKKVVEEEKKMSALQQGLNRIRKAKLDEHNWPKHWDELREWGKNENARNLTIAIIKSYLNAPIIDNFGNLKEEVAKFIVSRYHDGILWLDQPIAIIEKLINFIIGLPLNGEPILVGSKNPSLLERFTISTQKGKKLKRTTNQLHGSTIG